MKSFLIWFSASCLLSLITFFCGRGYQSLKSGYKLEVLTEELIETSLGTVKRQQVMETIGLGFLDTDTSIIQLDDVTLYKARRGFQEDSPVARELKVEGKTLSWQDGYQRYHLTIEPAHNDTAKQAPSEKANAVEKPTGPAK